MENFDYICGKIADIMTELRDPIGMLTFSDIIEEGYAYVDITIPTVQVFDNCRLRNDRAKGSDPH